MKRISKERNEGRPLHIPRNKTERNTGKFDLHVAKKKKSDFILKTKLFRLVKKNSFQ